MAYYRYNYLLYKPELSLKENAAQIGCTVSSLKKHLLRTKSDRQFDAAVVKWTVINGYRKENPRSSLRQISSVLGYSINTIRKYLTISKNELIASKRDNEKISIFDTDNASSIRSVSSSQTQILRWIMMLYNEGRPFDCDLTASMLKFYKELPAPIHLYDKYPQLPQVNNLNKALILPDNVFSSIVYDLPFVVAPKDSKDSSIIRERFDYFQSIEELYQVNQEMLSLAFRLLKKKGIIVVKTMDITYAGRQFWVSDYVIQLAKESGLQLEDKFLLTKSSKLFNGGQQQRHARKYHSYFFVFRK